MVFGFIKTLAGFSNDWDRSSLSCFINACYQVINKTVLQHCCYQLKCTSNDGPWHYCLFTSITSVCFNFYLSYHTATDTYTRSLSYLILNNCANELIEAVEVEHRVTTRAGRSLKLPISNLIRT